MFCGLIPGSRRQRGAPEKKIRHPVRAGGTGSPPESDALRRDPASAGANEREVQDPQGPGG
ncbi:Hypothetical protein RMHFA_04003 [Roseomonas mucosa]|uniref:Uncharacterized protein n=1 Tax=Roseomonas mucosa TaxID=207340 RepID=A0A4Y1MTT6_9PROT|nr:Hypothetical protein RADP37_04003 [Roseomonas mucosa]QDD93514.1 Hypothetical protein HVIM_04003 [Roseomonas mucosa]QDD98617.1 Hypothetical protein ADP8_04003 [Roseomonas mucosa]UZO90809.1 Hypothetical protein RMP42_04003 [Roseomonas mucosa]UZO95640.1 Hypothetical protein RMHFA_04003 [Roseomonas mucosa]